MWTPAWLRRGARRYGGRRSFLYLLAARAWARLGGYRRYRRVRWIEVRRLVFVCKGNICRSPYAEHRARALGLEATSTGLQAGHGPPVEPRALAEARRRGFDLETARSTVAGDIRLRPGDLLLFMEPRQVSELPPGMDTTPGIQRSLLGLWATPVSPCIPDPWGGDEQRFAACFDLIDTGVTAIARRIPPAGG